MSEWTKTPPTEPGWYWWRGYYDPEVLQIVIFSHGPRIFYEGEWCRFEEIEGEYWPGRIEEPE